MEKVRLGRVVGTHGIKGEIKIYLTTQFPEERFAPGKMIYLVHQNQETGYEVESFRMHKGMALVKLAAFNNINEVEGFRDDEVYGDREELLDEEGFYYDELIGCTIIDEDNRQLGEVVRVLEMPTQDLLEISYQGKIYRIPYVDAFILGEDIENKRIYVHLIKGLYDED